jgi:hypothetical protein
MEINQDSFTQVAFAENLHRSIKRVNKAFRAEEILIQKLEGAKKEKEIATDLIFDKLLPVSDDELKILARNYPDAESFINIFIETRKEKAENRGVIK